MASVTRQEEDVRSITGAGIDGNRGYFITFEGGEGTGKSTQLSMLDERLRSQGIETLCTREPGGTPIGEGCRGLLLDPFSDPTYRTEVLLLQTARAQLTERVIMSALARGVWVLCDRYVDSTRAYQGFARGFGIDALEPIIAFATGGLEPDLTFLFDGDVTTCVGRARTRGAPGENRFDDESMGFHQKVRDGYLQLAAMYPGRIRVIDVAQVVPRPPEDIFADVCRCLDLFLQRKS